MQNPSMADNVLRIVFEGDGGPGGHSQTPYGPHKPNPYSSESTMGFRQRYGGGEASAARQSFDPAAIAARRLEGEHKQLAIQQHFNLRKFGKFGGGIANMTSKLGMPNPMVGMIGRGAALLGPLGVLAGAAVAGGVAAHHMTSNLANKHANLGFSPDVAMAKAGAEVSRTQRDIRESQVLGPSLAKFMESQTRIQEVIADLLLPMKEVMVDIVANVMKFIADILKDIHAMLVKWGWLEERKDNPAEVMVEEFLAMVNPWAPVVAPAGAGGVAAGAIDKARAIRQLLDKHPFFGF